MDIRLLGDKLRMSVTPVREALARLHAEKLVRLAPHHGYAVVRPSARRLEHLYDFSAGLLHFCLERPNRSRQCPDHHARFTPSGIYAEDLADLLKGIAAAKENSAVCDTLDWLNDQLSGVRRCEPRLFPHAAQELTSLIALWIAGNFGDLRLRLRDYHRTRLVKIDALARVLEEQSGDV